MRGRQHRHCGSTVQFRCAVLKRKPSEQQLYSAAPRVQSGTRKDHYRDAERQRDQQRPHRPQSARVVKKRAGRVRIVLQWTMLALRSLAPQQARMRTSADAQARSDERMLRSLSGGDGSYGGGAAADEDEEHHRAELGPRVLDLRAHAMQQCNSRCNLHHTTLDTLCSTHTTPETLVQPAACIIVRCSA